MLTVAAISQALESLRFLLSVFVSVRTGADVAERRASTVARTLKVLKGCILQQQSVMRARASGTSQGAEGMDGNRR